MLDIFPTGRQTGGLGIKPAPMGEAFTWQIHGDGRLSTASVVSSIPPAGDCPGEVPGWLVEGYAEQRPSSGNEREEILTATRQLLALMIRRNDIDREDVASAIFTTTADLDAEFPALAARQLGWLDVPLLCGHELTVPGSLPRCIRVLVHWNTERAQNEIEHIYIRDAVRLRPDLSKLPPVNWDELEAWINEQMREQP